MTSFVRSSAIISIALAVTAAGGVGLAASASAASAPSASATATATPTTTAAPTSAPATAVPTASATAAPTATSGATSATDQDPSLATQNATGNHAMGSTIPAADAATGSTSLTIHSLAKVQATAQAATTSGSSVRGLDVSGYQTSINWKTVAANGAKFAYVKATEGTTYASSSFASQYNGAYSAGLIRSAYHFATPNTSTGAAQATYFVAHGGGWSADGHTLPPLLDIEYGYNATCWGLSQAAMVSWISSFSNTVLSLTGTRPAIYSTTDWWSQCTGNSKSFSANPLMIAHYTSASTPGTLPASWSNWNIWQWADAGTFPGDQDVFNGTATALTVMALGSSASNVPVTPPTASSTLATGVTLASGQAIKSSNGQFTLTMQTDGNLVLSGNGHVMWYTRTNGNAGAHLVMQADGNLVVYTAAGKAIWATATTGASSKLVVSSTGQVIVSNSVGVAWTTSWTGTSYLTAGTSLAGGQTIHDTTGYIQAVMQSDGNFVVYINRKAHWSTRTSTPGSRLAFQTDGNMVVYSPTNRVLWQSKTSGTKGILNMQADGNLVLTAGGRVKWYSHTSI